MATKKVSKKAKGKATKKKASALPKLPKELQAALNRIPQLVTYQKELHKHFNALAKKLDKLVKTYKRNPMRIFSSR